MSAVALLDRVAAEAALFAAVTLLLLGLDDLLLDLIAAAARRPDRVLRVPAGTPPLRFALFVPAWREERVIGAMLRATLARYDHGDYRIYVGCYPNDPATAAAVRAVDDARLRLVVGARDGPTTKADCLNQLWRVLAADRDWRPDAVVLHDAEDMVHPLEPRAAADALRDAALVQLPVLPLIDPARRWITGHYADEFAETHARDLVARGALGAALPLAGVGCAIRYAALEQLAAANGLPFAADSLTEDYELGLRAAALGLTVRFTRWRDAAGGLIATRAYFPDTLPGAVRQKARWVGGIALAGWDRTGWGARRVAERWMRWRDRRAPLAAAAVTAGYTAVALAAMSAAGHHWRGDSPPMPPRGLRAMLAINAVLLGWRLVARARLTAAAYGWREGLRALPRIAVANAVLVLSAWRAARLHVAALRGAPLRWEKTAHRFPDVP
ncbi:glycosyl transferase family protein [Sphingomonas sp. RHCKR7]|uniref:glycosyl transferase family protein n=1 Tax=Sphingomonas folli TaxID=2862497 RepID=UPI001CA4EEAF|nr:glycosyl transferase family protein [Sphingomonas folli]MBW6528071.1 glycosyl transferase family protein [Sphingomonas folli]